MKNVLLVLLYAVASLNQSAFADDAHHKKSGSGTSAQAPAMTEGEVRKVDKAARTITLKHGPIENLGMPGMTMVFHVKDAIALDKVKPGNKVRFVAENLKDKFTVTRIEASK